MAAIISAFAGPHVSTTWVVTRAIILRSDAAESAPMGAAAAKWTIADLRSDSGIGGAS